jgi:hypothetical protein
MTVVVNRRSDLTLDSYRRVALESEDVTVGPVARESMTAARAGFTALLDSLAEPPHGFAILAVVASQALFVTDREPAARLGGLAAGVRSVFPPVNGALRRDQGAEAGQLAEVIAAGARTGCLDFPAAARGRPGADAAGGPAGGEAR